MKLFYIHLVLELFFFTLRSRIVVIFLVNVIHQYVGGCLAGCIYFE